MSGIEEVAAPWQAVALVCGKCSRKLKGGFGRKGKRGLDEVLREGLKAAGRRRELRVIEVGCLGLCPKRGVTVAGMAGQVWVVPAGAEIEEVLRVMDGPLLRREH